VLGFIFKQRQHGLMTAMHAIEITNRQCAGACKLGVAVTAKDFHHPIIVLIAAKAG
jgi:hypothetical protein